MKPRKVIITMEVITDSPIWAIKERAACGDWRTMFCVKDVKPAKKK